MDVQRGGAGLYGACLGGRCVWCWVYECGGVTKQTPLGSACSRNGGLRMQLTWHHMSAVRKEGRRGQDKSCTPVYWKQPPPPPRCRRSNCHQRPSLTACTNSLALTA
jgi:hypothetical protein